MIRTIRILIKESVVLDILHCEQHYAGKYLQMTNPTNVKRYYPIILRDQRVQNAARIATSAVHVVIERYVKVMIKCRQCCI